MADRLEADGPAGFRDIAETLRASRVGYALTDGEQLNALADRFDRFAERLEREAAKFREVAEMLEGIAREMAPFDGRRAARLVALAGRFDQCSAQGRRDMAPFQVHSARASRGR